MRALLGTLLHCMSPVTLSFMRILTTVFSISTATVTSSRWSHPISISGLQHRGNPFEISEFIITKSRMMKSRKFYFNKFKKKTHLVRSISISGPQYHGNADSGYQNLSLPDPGWWNHENSTSKNQEKNRGWCHPDDFKICIPKSLNS